LPPPRSQRLGGDLGGSPPSTPTEQELAAIWATVFRRTGLSAEADFFVDLGGHSLLAAVLVSQLRQQPRWRGLALRDLYAHPSIRSLARHADEQAAAHTSQTDAPQTLDGPRTERLRHSDRRVRVCGLAQAVLLYLLWVLVGTPLSLQLSGGSIRTPLALLGAAVVAIPIGLILSFLLPLAVKWLLIGRFRPGRYPLWGWYFCRWWLVRKIQEMAPLALFSGSPFLPLYLRLLGARIGSSCHIGTSRIHLPDLVEIGAGVSLGYGVEVVPFVVEGGWLEMAPIRIAAASFVGANAVLLAGGRIGRGSKLAEQSLLARGQVIPDQEMWAGSPSERCQVPDQLFDQIAASPPPAQSWSPSLWAGIVAGLVLLLLLPLLAAAPGMVIAFVFADGNLLRGLMLAPLAGLIFVFSACVLILACKRLFLPTVRPGLHPLRSAFGLRKWLVDQLIALSLSLTNSLYGTLYTIPWLRLLGVKVGPRSEVSTVSRFDPDLLTLGRESFVADIAVVGAARHAEGYIALGPTRLGTRCFVGNAALLPSGTQLSDGILIGVHSIPPARTPEPGTSWLGSPAIYLPRRQDSGSFPESRTYHPPARLVVCRLAIEFFRVFLPSVLLSLALLLGTLSVQWLAMYLPGPVLVAALPLPYLGMTVAVVAAVIALKWLIVGRYRRRVEPLWSHFVWRTELITGLYESAAVPALLRWLTGTPLLAPFLRLFGARIGRRVYLDTTFLTEFDLVRVDDDAMIGCTTSLQTHLFEDRVMKMSNLTVGAGCAVGPRTVVLYDATLGSGAQLDALSLLMKGEELPPDTSWRGIPARLVENE
jgi:non-ribosomal peptide synthetase-like protein